MERVPDPVDYAAALALAENDALIDQARRKPVHSPSFTGACLFCRRRLKDRRWCNAACRDAWQEANP